MKTRLKNAPCGLCPRRRGIRAAKSFALGFGLTIATIEKDKERAMSNISQVASSVIRPQEMLGDSLRLEFAKLQFTLAALSKTQSQERVEQVKSNNTEQLQVAKLLGQALALQAAARTGKGDCPWDKYASCMTKEMQDYMDKNGLYYDRTGNDNVHNPREWESVINSLTAQLQKLSAPPSLSSSLAEFALASEALQKTLAISTGKP